MAKKLAITYYRDIMRGIVADIDIHSSGKEALNYFMKNADKYFSTPTVWKNKRPESIPTGKSISVGMGFRFYICRFLSEEESNLYKKYGDECLFDPKYDTLISPENS